VNSFRVGTIYDRLFNKSIADKSGLCIADASVSEKAQLQHSKDSTCLKTG